jgi:prepilin-type processing-associated H-X9-DG protein
MTADPGWEIIHQTYRSRVSEVGSPAGKIAAADGFRYLAEDDTLDFDPSPAPRYFGSFTSSGAYWCGSTEYGVRPGTKNWSNRPVTAGNDPPGRGKNLALSYRHGVRGGISGTAQDNRGTVNALFFDGSVRRLTDRASRTPNLWYPKGAKVYKYQQGMIDDLRNNDLVP